MLLKEFYIIPERILPVGEVQKTVVKHVNAKMTYKIYQAQQSKTFTL